MNDAKLAERLPDVAARIAANLRMKRIDNVTVQNAPQFMMWLDCIALTADALISIDPDFDREGFYVMCGRKPVSTCPSCRI